MSKYRILTSLLTLIIASLHASSIPAQQNPASAKLPPATSMLSPSICGKGAFVFWFGEQSIGREEFEIKCQPDGGFASSGHTILKGPGPGMDLKSTVEVDRTGEPLSSTAIGTVNGQPFDQSVSIKGAVAVVTASGSTKELPFSKGTSLLGGNIFHMFHFVVARYDSARGGSQEFQLFPATTAKIERIARDELQATGIAAAPAPSTFDRYSITIGISGATLWVDSKGRVATISVPLQNFAAVRENTRVRSILQGYPFRQDEGERA